MVTIRRMETDLLVNSLAPLAAAAYSKVANPRVRNTASIGGNVAHGDYRLDPPVALLALGASVEVTSQAGPRRIPAAEFFVDFQRTALRPGELVTAIEVPAMPAEAAASYVKLSSLSARDWPCASAAALLIPGDAAGRRSGWRSVPLRPCPGFPQPKWPAGGRKRWSIWPWSSLRL